MSAMSEKFVLTSGAGVRTGSEAGQQRTIRSANSGRHLVHQQAQSAQQASSFGALHIRAGNLGQESLQLNVQVVFQSQCDRVR